MLTWYGYILQLNVEMCELGQWLYSLLSQDIKKKEGGQEWNIFNIKKKYTQINSFALHPHTFNGWLLTQSSSGAADNLLL